MKRFQGKEQSLERMLDNVIICQSEFMMYSYCYVTYEKNGNYSVCNFLKKRFKKQCTSDTFYKMATTGIVFFFSVRQDRRNIVAQQVAAAVAAVNGGVSGHRFTLLALLRAFEQSSLTTFCSSIITVQSSIRQYEFCTDGYQEPGTRGYLDG